MNSSLKLLNVVAAVSATFFAPNLVHAQEQPTGLSAMLPATSIPQLATALDQADSEFGFDSADNPRTWYLQNIETIQKSTSAIGCSVGGLLMVRAGGGLPMARQGCKAGRIGFSKLSNLINPLKYVVGGAPAEDETVFGKLPVRDAASAVKLLSGSLDGDSRDARQRSLASETRNRAGDLAALEERRKRNSGIWGQILLGAAQTYLAYETGKSQAKLAQSMATMGSSGTAGSNGVMIQRRDANGQNQGQYRAPGAHQNDQQAQGAYDEAVPDVSLCVKFRQTDVTSDSYRFSLTNTCSFGIAVRWDRQDGHGWEIWGRDLGSGEVANHYAGLGRTVTYFACPLLSPNGKKVRIKASLEKCIVE